jgi:hypothetical protein
MRAEIVSGVDFADYGFSDHRVTEGGDLGPPSPGHSAPGSLGIHVSLPATLPPKIAPLGVGRKSLLQAHLLQPAPSVAATLIRKRHNRMTIEQMLEMPYDHAVLEEALRTALHDVNAKLRAVRRVGGEPVLDKV